MKMRIRLKAFSAAIMVFVLAVALFSADKLVPSIWSTAPPRVDGVAGEWAADAMSFDKNANVDYAFRNDGRNLYVVFIFKDPRSLSSIDLTGMTMYFGSREKKQKDFGVRFIKKNITADQLIEKFEKQGQTLTEERKKELKASPMYVFFEVEAVTKKGEVIPSPPPTAEVDPPAFRAGKQESLIIYEFRVPLAGRETHPAGAGGKPGETVKVGFEWGGLTKEMRDAIISRLGAEGSKAVSRDSGMAAEDTRATGERGEGDEGASSPALTMMRAEAKRFPKHSFWVDIRLAAAQ